MRKAKTVAVFLAILAIVFSGSYGYSHEDSASSIRSKVEKFDYSLQNSQYGNIWDMMTVGFKARVTKKSRLEKLRAPKIIYDLSKFNYKLDTLRAANLVPFQDL